MTNKELRVLFNIPNERVNTFNVILSRMKHVDGLLTLHEDYDVVRNRYEYKEPAIEKIRKRLGTTFKRSKINYNYDKVNGLQIGEEAEHKS